MKAFILTVSGEKLLLKKTKVYLITLFLVQIFTEIKQNLFVVFMSSLSDISRCMQITVLCGGSGIILC